jgi:hypothetical protein
MQGVRRGIREKVMSDRRVETVDGKAVEQRRDLW